MNALEYAIKMEYEGENYYTEQMEKNRNNKLFTVCKMLAEDERKHAQILNSKLKGLPYELKDTDALAEAKSIFANLRDIKTEDKEITSQLDFYRIALKLEKESIDLYTDLLGKTEDSKEKELFSFLIKQEEHHYQILDELVVLLSRTEEWVESAEFGVREEY